jgi:hypothetical protein
MVSQSHKDDPAYWRNRAKELRELAHHITQLDHKEEIFQMAQRYERLAQSILPAWCWGRRLSFL